MSLQIITRQLRKSSQIAGLKCRLSSASIHPIRRHVFQEQGCAVLDNLNYKLSLNVKLSRNILLRNLCTAKISSWKPVTYIETLEVQQLKPDDYKKIVLDLVSHMYNSNLTACQNVFHTSTYHSVFFPVYKLPLSEGFTSYSNIIEYQEHICKLDVFNAFLETLANNFESIGIGDQLDIYGGLILLGIPKTHWVMSQLFCQFSKPECVMTLSELAKLSAVYSHCTRNDILQLTVILPKMKPMLNAITIQDQEDLKNFSILLKHGITWIVQYPFIFEKCLQIILDAVIDTDVYKDLESSCQILHSLFCDINSHHSLYVGNHEWKSSPIFLEISVRLFHLIEPHIEHLTCRQVAEAFTAFRKQKHFIIRYIIVSIFENFSLRLTEHSLKLLRGDLPNTEKLYCFEGIVDHLFVSDSERRKLLEIISKIIPDADVNTLFQICEVMEERHNLLKHNGMRKLSPVYFSLRDQLVKHWHVQSVDCLDKALSIVEFLQSGSRTYGFYDLLPGLTPYITQALNRSGYGCLSTIYGRAYQFLIPVHGSEISPTDKTKIMDMILSIKDPHIVGRLLYGAMYTFNISKDKKSLTEAHEIVQLAKETIKNKTLSFKELQLLNSQMLEDYDKVIINSTTSGLGKEVAVKFEALEINKDVFTYFLRRKIHSSVLSENSANRLFEYYMGHFNSDSDGSMLDPRYIHWKMVYMFLHISRLPRNKDKLEELSKYIFDVSFDDILVDESLKLLVQLSKFHIFLDEYIKKVFSTEYLDKLDVILQSETGSKKRKKDLLRFFGTLNRTVVLLRPDLNIPWISDNIKKKIYQYPRVELKKDVREEVQEYLAYLLGGHCFFKANVIDEYALRIDFKLYLSADGVPVDYETAQNMDISRTGVQKVAVSFFRPKQHDFHTNDPHCMSLDDRETINYLEALGYKVVYIPRHEWKTRNIPGIGADYLRNKIIRSIK